MCLYPRLIFNPKYRANKKNGGVTPAVQDSRILYVPVKCNKCMECRKQISREWQVRLLEDIKANKNGKFITLTFSNEAIAELCEKEVKVLNEETNEMETKHIMDFKGYDRDNKIATKAVRLFLERWRKEHKKSLRHWFVTEIGHKGTENIHLHGIIWTDKDKETVESIWKYGYIWMGNKKENGKIENYVNEKTIGYITKYITKIDEKHTTYKGIILTSSGIGSAYMKRNDWKKNTYRGEETREYYKTQSGHKIALPIYYRNKIYSEAEREKLWIDKLNKEERWVCGEKVSIKNGEKDYEKLVEYYRTINKRFGYSTGIQNYDKEQYEKQRRAIMQETRIQKGKRQGL